jgi:hypothetical protein
MKSRLIGWQIRNKYCAIDIAQSGFEFGTTCIHKSYKEILEEQSWEVHGEKTSLEMADTRIELELRNCMSLRNKYYYGTFSLSLLYQRTLIWYG